MSGKNSRVRQRQSSSGNSTGGNSTSGSTSGSAQKPPAKRRNNQGGKDDITEVEDMIDMEQMTSENEFEEEEESQESLIQKLVLAIERKKGGKVGQSENGNGNRNGNNGQKKKMDTKMSGNSKAETTANISEIIDQAVSKALATIVPIMKNLILEVVDQRFEKMKEEMNILHNQVQMTRVRNVIELDAQEQYSRRDNLLITGIKEEEGENTNTLIENVQELLSAIDIKMEANAVSAIHRIGKPRTEKNRTVIVRTTRLVKQEVTGKKKQLKYNAKITSNPKTEDKVFINEDITEPRRRIMEFIKESGLVEYCFIREGTIVCKQGTRFIHVQNADDLFQLGVNHLQYEDYYPSLE
jgi:hypothetical protein